MVAISADEPEESVIFAREGHLKFPLLRDPDLSVADAYGVAMQNREIAIPATFIISQSGTIEWKTVGETMADRPDLDEIIEVIDGLRKP